MGREHCGSPAVVLEHVSKSFGNGLVVDGVSFSVEKGTCLGLLGENGAGKSTTLKMIYGSLRPSSGVIRVEGIEVARHTSKAKRRLGIAPQDDTLDAELNVEENLLFHARYSGISRAESRERVEGVLGLMDLGGRRSEPVSLLSAGLRRRLVLARALLGDASVIVLDEPTRGLDAASRSAFLDRVRLLKRGGVSVLLATHDLEEAEALCDRIAVMEKGKIADIGAAGALLRAAVKGPSAAEGGG